MNQTDEGEGMASVIPFPLHRVTPPHQAPVTDSLAPDGPAAPVSPLTPEEPVGVEDLKARIKDIEAQPVPPVETPRQDAKENHRAKNIALHQLGVSGRSEAEVRERLVARDISPDVIEEEVSRLLSVGLIDDRDLATTLVESLRGRKKLGDSAISQTLRRRKIPQDIITEVLAEGDFDSDVAVFELARDRARSMRHLDKDVAFRRIVGFVQRRGYSGPQVFEAARRAVDSAQDVS